MQPIIRKITTADDPELGKLIRNVLEEFKANKPGTVYFDESTFHLSTLFHNPQAVYWVIEENGVVIGGCGIFPTPNLPALTCELVKLYLHPEARGRGLGKSIVQKSLESAVELGYQSVYLESMPELNQAVSMYEKLGFEKLDGPLGDSGHFGCDIWMLKKL